MHTSQLLQRHAQLSPSLSHGINMYQQNAAIDIRAPPVLWVMLNWLPTIQ